MVGTTYRNEYPRNHLLIFHPSLSILGPAPLDVPACTVQNHSREENRIKPWKWTFKTRDNPPSEGEIDVTSVMYLACILHPTVSEDDLTGRRFESSRMFNCLPRELRECVSRYVFATFLCSESIFLAASGVPYPVYEEVRCEKKSQSRDAK